jgi:hypothetical protein
MAAKRYRVMVFTGVKRLDLVRQRLGGLRLSLMPRHGANGSGSALLRPSVNGPLSHRRMRRYRCNLPSATRDGRQTKG